VRCQGHVALDGMATRNVATRTEPERRRATTSCARVVRVASLETRSLLRTSFVLSGACCGTGVMARQRVARMVSIAGAGRPRRLPNKTRRAVEGRNHRV
jgi:hypothetical protein